MQRLYKAAILAFLTTLLYVGCVSTQAQKLPKKLIEFGWDVPTPDFVQQNIKQMEKRPFDGIVIKLKGGKKVFLHEPYDSKEFTQDLQSLKSTNFTKFTDNFVLMWATPDEGWDWFSDSDWQASEQNIRLFAGIARSAGFVGIAFDPEHYGVHPWKYVTLSGAKDKSFEEYWQQVRKRGAQFMQALQEEIPDVKVLSLFQLSYLENFLDEANLQKRMRQMSTESYGLLAAFLNGMLDVAQANTRIVDGNEHSYYYAGRQEFLDTHKLIKERLLTFVDEKNRQKYAKQVQVGQAIYIDHLFDLGKAQESRVSHYLTPQQRQQWLEHNTYHGLSTSDEYVWCYSEEMNWWKNNVPSGAEEAIRSAQQKIKIGEPLGFNIEGTIRWAKMLQMTKNIIR
ncbi:hypothetical protein [Microcoleus sp. Pol12B4]|uniref:hypothetical protein n=1 Tax=Microcoleus sp. Pol12B4 TaxID=3055395 RepID=UPI002FD64861